MTEPSLSIIIPAYNAKLWIADCIDSALRSYSGDLEVICVDDGSTDKTAEIVKKYYGNDSRVKCISQANQGRCIARNLGIELSTGDWIGFLDADDQIAPHAFDSIASILSMDVSMVCSLGKNISSYPACDADVLDWRIECASLDVEESLSFLLDCEQGRKNESIQSKYTIFNKYNTMWCSAVFTKLFSGDGVRRGGVRFVPGLKFGEDMLFIYDYLRHQYNSGKLIQFSSAVTHCYNTSSEGTIRTYKQGDLAALKRTLYEWSKRDPTSVYGAGIASCCMRNCLFLSVRAAKFLPLSIFAREINSFLDADCFTLLFKRYKDGMLDYLPSKAKRLWKYAASCLMRNQKRRYAIAVVILGLLQKVKDGQ